MPTYLTHLECADCDTRHDATVEQHRCRVADQGQRPAQDDRGADHADQRVDRRPAEGPAEAEAADRQHRRRRIGHHMQIGGAQVEIAVTMVIDRKSALPLP